MSTEESEEEGTQRLGLAKPKAKEKKRPCLENPRKRREQNRTAGKVELRDHLSASATKELAISGCCEAESPQRGAQREERQLR